MVSLMPTKLNMAKQVNFLGLILQYAPGKLWSIFCYPQNMVGHICKISKVISAWHWIVDNK